VGEPKLIVGRELVRELVELVRGAERELVVVMFEWAWYEGQRAGTVQDVNRAVCGAARRGVRVRVLLHGEAARRPLARINGKSRGRLVRNGVEVRMGNTGRVLHAKMWLADGERWVVGSHNMSTRATTSNAEVSVVGEGGDVARGLAAFFEELWERGMVPG
jgi:phosphatidylserine/phosphatidylglycerophosphate/cardiolipin synthase-like enzyme